MTATEAARHENSAALLDQFGQAVWNLATATTDAEREAAIEQRDAAHNALLSRVHQTWGRQEGEA